MGLRWEGGCPVQGPGADYTILSSARAMPWHGRDAGFALKPLWPRCMSYGGKWVMTV